MYEWLVINSFWISIIIELIGVAATILLTVLIIRQTKKLNQQQLDMQKRQIKVDLFPIKRELFLNLQRVFNFAEDCSSRISNYKSNPTGGTIMSSSFNCILTKHIDDYGKISDNLKEAEYLLPTDIANSVISIAGQFSKLYKQISDLTRINDEQLKQKINTLDIILHECKEIESMKVFIYEELPNNIKIGDLDS